MQGGLAFVALPAPKGSEWQSPERSSGYSDRENVGPERVAMACSMRYLRLQPPPVPKCRRGAVEPLRCLSVVPHRLNARLPTKR